MGVNRLNLEDQELPITIDEVRAAIMELPADKAPGADGFSSLFFKKSWTIIQHDLMRAIKALESKTSRNLHLLNSATMILLPKSPDAAHPKEFRLISLVHLFSKLFTKILAKRLRPRMHELVSPCQSAFIQNRMIHDNFVFVCVLAKLLRQKKTPALILKLDLQKAFDSVSWEFLLEVLEAKGFGTKWRDWIACLLLLASTRIVVNGELTKTWLKGEVPSLNYTLLERSEAPCGGCASNAGGRAHGRGLKPTSHQLVLTDRFFHRRGLRQGDPLSPLLFAIISDILASLFAMADRQGVLKTNRFLHPKHIISLYVDDVIIFSKPVHQDLEAIRLLLHDFGEASGLFTNFLKSCIITIHCHGIDINSLYNALQCQTKTFPYTYLGLPLSGLPLSDTRLHKSDLHHVLDKLAANVKGWNKGCFSLDARLLLVKHVLSAMHIYQLLVLDPPA
jgi:hypothetical protein